MDAETVRKLLSLHKSLKNATRLFAKMDLHITPDGEVEINKEWVKKHVVQAGSIQHTLGEVFEIIYPEIEDELTYHARKQWSDEKEFERKQLNKLAILPGQSG